jgi:hypothetical protein
MEADIKSLDSAYSVTVISALEVILRAINCAQLRAGLQRWFDISLQKHNHFHAPFTTEQLTLFAVKIPDPVSYDILTNQKSRKEKTMNANVLINQWILVICPPE